MTEITFKPSKGEKNFIHIVPAEYRDSVVSVSAHLTKNNKKLKITKHEKLPSGIIPPVVKQYHKISDEDFVAYLIDLGLDHE